jgi:DNA-binding CsgD family transcriptional regulator
MKRLRDWALPLIYLSTNWISLIGVGLVTTSVIFWLFLLPSTWEGKAVHPYLGILTFLILPMGFFAGLCIIPLGVALRLRSDRKAGRVPETSLPLDWTHGPLRRLIVFVGVTTFANIMLASQFTYRAVTYIDSVGFCGQACHTVMKPEFTAYQASAHSRVECVKCHIGPGASWFVRSKLSGLRQVAAVALDTHPRPIPVPIEDLRPARETCEACHWPQKYGADRVRITEKFTEDEANTRLKNVLIMRIGGGGSGPRIHGVHLAEGVVIRYRHADPKRQTIPWVRQYHPPQDATCRLSPQETRLLKVLGEGHHYKTAATELGISVHTVRFHLRSIYSKFEVHSKSEAVAKALAGRSNPLGRTRPAAS